MSGLVLLMCDTDYRPVLSDFDAGGRYGAVRARRVFETQQDLALWLSTWPAEDDAVPWLLESGAIEGGDAVWDFLWPGAASGR